MLRQGSGSIVNTSSILGQVGRPAQSAYCAAKSGVIGLTRSVALDYAKHGVRVNALCPGPVRTAMAMDPAIHGVMERMIDATPMARMGEVDEVAATVLWLTMGRSTYITGQAITVDGGYTVG